MKKKTPKYSNSRKQKDALTTKAMANEFNINVENMSFSSFYDKLQKINEEASIKEYPPQAIGRKRNMFLKTLALDDNEFKEWVQNRMYRIAFDNKKSVSDFTPKDIGIGLQKWEGVLRDGDPGFGQYAEQFKKYSQRFLNIASGLLTTDMAGQGTKGVDPSDAPPNSPAQAPAGTPSLVKFQMGGGGGVSGGGNKSSGGASRAAPVGAGSPPAASAPKKGEVPQITPEEHQIDGVLQDMVDALQMKDKEFVSHVENKLLQDGIDPMSVNPVEMEDRLDDDFQTLLDGLPTDSPIDPHEIEIIYGEYKERFIRLTGTLLNKAKKSHDAAGEVAALRVGSIKGDASTFEIATVASAAFALGQPLQTAGLSSRETKKIQQDKVTFGASSRLINTLFTSYPALSKTEVFWMGRETGKHELHSNWNGSSAAPITDMVFDFGETRWKFKNDKFVRCSPKDRTEEGMSKVRVNFFVNNIGLNPKNPQETKAIFEAAIENLRTKDYDLVNPSRLYHRFLADGIEPTEARERAADVIHTTQIMREAFKSIEHAEHTEKIYNIFGKYLITHLNKITELLPGLKQEFVYVSLTGCGRYTDSSDREANFILSSDENGDKVVFRPIDDELSARIAHEIEMKYKPVVAKLGKTDPIIQKYVSKGMTIKDAELKVSTEEPYRISKILELIKASVASNSMTNPQAQGQILPENSILYSFIKNIKLLREQDEMVAPPQQMDQENLEYIEAAIDYAFSTFTNLIRFFEVDFMDVAVTEFNLHNMFFAEQSQNMVSDINNRVDTNNQIVDKIQQERVENGNQNKWFEYKQKGT